MTPIEKRRYPRTGPPSRAEIAAAQRKLVATLPNVRTDPAATCWACGYSDAALPPATARLHAAAPAFKPQRAHIVARVHGGSWAPRNFLLLCHPCHKEQPDGACREDQLRWLRAHPHWFGDSKYAVVEDRLKAEAAATGEPWLLGLWVMSIGDDDALARRVHEWHRDAATAAAGSRNRVGNFAAILCREFRAFAVAVQRRMDEIMPRTESHCDPDNAVAVRVVA